MARRSSDQKPERGGNRYCARLGIRPPRVEEFLARGGSPRLFPLIVIALLERGESMTLEQLVDRLASTPVGDRERLEVLILRSWHGLKPVVRDGRGRFRLDLHCAEVEFFLHDHGLRPRAVPLPAPFVAPAEPSLDDPLTLDELAAALAGGGGSTMSALRRAAAVLDATGLPATVAEIEGVLRGLSRGSAALGADAVRQFARYDLFEFFDDGRIGLNRGSSRLRNVREAVRRKARSTLVARAEREHHANLFARNAERNRAQARQREVEALLKRRAIVRVWPPHGRPAAGVIIDINEHSIATFSPLAPLDVVATLQTYDILAGVDIWDALDLFEVDVDRCRVIDLGPPQKSMTDPRTDRPVRLRHEAILRDTTGRSLTAVELLDADLAAGAWPDLVTRLGKDARALHDLYRYGVLHQAVRVRIDAFERRLGVTWAEAGDQHLYDILRMAMDSDTRVDLVVGRAPDWNDPWRRAMRVRVKQLDVYSITVVGEAEPLVIDRDDVQAVRIPSPHEAGG